MAGEAAGSASRNPVAATLVFTGDGKGKSTAAFGTVLRAIGHGQSVLVIQFLKSDPNSGELLACAHLPGVEVVQRGRGFVPPPDHPAYALHRETAAEALALAGKAVRKNTHDLVVLDEICGALAHGLIALPDVLPLIRMPNRRANLILTGRHAPPELLAEADTVTEMRCVHHAYQKGVKAREGIEF